MGSSIGKPNSLSADLTNLMFFAAVTAAINSALVELEAVVDCAFNWHKTVPPPQVTACPVVDCLLVGSFPQAASTTQINLDLVVSDGQAGSIVSVELIPGVNMSGRLSMIPFW